MTTKRDANRESIISLGVDQLGLSSQTNKKVVIDREALEKYGNAKILNKETRQKEEHKQRCSKRHKGLKLHNNEN